MRLQSVPGGGGWRRARAPIWVLITLISASARAQGEPEEAAATPEQSTTDSSAEETGAEPATQEQAPESAAAEPTAPESVEAGAALGAEWRVEFRADEDLRVRAAIGQDEMDVDGRLLLDAAVAEPRDHFGGEAALGLWSDLDGVRRPHEPSSFSEIHEPRSMPVWIDVYTLAGRYQSAGLLRSARAGRLVVQRELPVTLDGASLELSLLEPYLEVFTYGGRSVHFFEIEQGLFEDWIGGLGAATQPLPGLKLEIDYALRVEDTEMVQGLVEHDYGVAAWYRLGGWFGAHLFARGLDARLAYVGGAARGGWPEQDLGVELSVKAQVTELDELTELDDPYFAVLGRSDPFVRWRLDAFKGLDTSVGDFALHLGGDGRQLLADASTPFNRTFGRLYLMAEARDIVVDGPFLSVALERHSVDWDFTGHGVWSVSGAGGYQAGALRAEIGSRYDAYKYTYYASVDEVQDVRTFYGQVRYQLFDALALRAWYEYERFAWDVHTLRVGLAQIF